MPDRPLRAAVIGAGLAARALHLPCLREIPGVEAVALCDRDGERASALARTEGIASVHEDAARMLASESLDLALILTPPESHEALALAALDAGLHVLLEKPFTYDLAGADRVVARAAAAGRQLSVIHNELFNPGVDALRARLPEIGSLCSVQYTAARRSQHFVPDPWYYRTYGGRMGETLPHALCLLTTLVDGLEVLHVDARSLGHQIPPKGFEDLPLGIDELRVELARPDGSVTAHIWYSLNTDIPTNLVVAGSEGHLLAYPFGRVTELSATPTNLRSELPGMARHAVQRLARRLHLSRPGPQRVGETSHYRQIRDFVESLHSGRPPAVTPRDAREVVRLWQEIVGRYAGPP